MNKLFFKILAFAAAATLLSACHRETKDEAAARYAREYTLRECPKDLDEYTSMDSLTFDIHTRELTYSYTVRGVLDDDEIYTDELYDLYHDNLLRDIKNNIDLKRAKQEGVTLVYRYFSQKTGEVRMELSFTKEDYQRK